MLVACKSPLAFISPTTSKASVGVVVPIPTFPELATYKSAPADDEPSIITPPSLSVLYISKSPFLLYSITPCSTLDFSNINLIGFAPPPADVNFRKSFAVVDEISSNALGAVVPIPTFPFVPSTNNACGLVTEPKLTSLVESPLMSNAPP